MTDMNSIDSNHSAVLLKTDSSGRVQRSRDEQEAILDAFEQSAMSGAQFARMHGINYQTFCYWRTRRRKALRNTDVPKVDSCADFNFIEVTSHSLAPANSGSIEIQIGSQTRISMTSSQQAPILAALIKELA